MRIILFILSTFIIITVYAQETSDNDNLFDEHDFGISEGITIYGQRPIVVYILDHINGTQSDRKKFIEIDFLEGAGFRRTGDVKFRKTETSEKALSVLHGVGQMFNWVGQIFGFGSIPMRPFSETEYDRLPKGEVYKFESVFIKSNFKDITPEVLIVIELEYMLQIEFCNGIIIRDNIKYYTDENINKFEILILRLPDFPENIYQAKNRYLNELQKIKAALERHRNPSENDLRALKNLENSFNMNRNK